MLFCLLFQKPGEGFNLKFFNSSILFILFTIILPTGINADSISEAGLYSIESKNFFNKPVNLNFKLRYDSHRINFDIQRDTFPYKPPGDNQEERHYSKTRQSENTSESIEFESGVMFNNTAYFYLKAGIGSFDCKLKLLDETFQGLYKKPMEFHLDDESLITYGAGASFKIFDKKIDTIIKKIESNLGIQYKKLVFDTEKKGNITTSYDLNLDEIQGSLLIRGINKNKMIYFGPRISNITGNETLKNGYNNFSYDDSIETTKNIGWVLGFNYLYKKRYSMSIQKRSGDEEGVSFETSVKF